ncbi:hypothetical protein PHMEG_0008283, partial [Phytophthora megakarya]
ASERVQNRAGRYVVEHEVEYGERKGEPAGRRWLSHSEFEALVRSRTILSAGMACRQVPCRVRPVVTAVTVIDLTGE